MEITVMTVVLFVIGAALGTPNVRVSIERGPIPWLLVSMIALAIPLFTVGPHPVVIGIYFSIAIYLLYIAQIAIRNPSAINELWKNIGKE